jgi:hypothetical protein
MSVRYLPHENVPEQEANRGSAMTATSRHFCPDYAINIAGKRHTLCVREAKFEDPYHIWRTA